MSSIVDSNRVSSVMYDKENGVNSNIEKTNNTSGSQQHTSAPNTHTPIASPSFKPPLRIKNVTTRGEVFDSLYKKTNINGLCTNQVCLGSTMALGTSDGKLRPIEKLLSEAKDFLDQYFLSIRRSESPSHKSRWTQVQKEVQNVGTYNLTETELIYGAKQAWRNSPRCIGRIQWSKLQVFDCRYVTTTSGMFDALCNHIKYSTNKGNIRSAITIFPQRTDGKHDFRVWNPQLLAYAGYRQADGSIMGDAINADFTEVCTKLGWRGHGSRFDILPLVLSANGHDPDYFDIPVELIIEVILSHPTLEWFQDLGLRWYVLPAVSNMMFDCGGLQFTACPFNGWYMSTEIGCRDLCDSARYNMLEPIAQRMGLDTRTHLTLWKDKAMVEANVAVLHSFQQRGVTIMDHHTASESFMKHVENEMRLRSGCPADWVWIVPPMSGSATPVFHQEMALYYLRPSYEYQEAAWKTHIWNKQRGDTDRASKKLRRKFHFKQIARAVRFASKLFGRALSRRIKATVLYATETGKSEGYAKMLKDVLGHAFNAQVHSMDDYDITNIEHEALLLVVTSTFGNGDPPENGEEFAKNLYGLKLSQCSLSNEHNSHGKLTMATSKSFIKANSQSDIKSKTINKFESIRRSVTDQLLEDTFGPLSNVRFAVFALGSSAYPNFCSFGKYVDNLLGELGGERLLKMVSGDEMCGQEQAFRKWAPEIYKLCCEAFCLDDDETILDASFSMNQSYTASTIRFAEVKPENMLACLTKCHNKKVFPCDLMRRANLHGENAIRATLKLEISSILAYSPGDHVGIFARNCQQYVDKIVDKLTDVPEANMTVELQTLIENHTLNEVIKTWTPHEKLPRCSIKELFSRFLDITTTPTPNLLQHFASIATDDKDKKQLQLLATDSSIYEDWRHWRSPNLLEVLEEFPSVRPHAALLVAQLGLLQPRFYSISSSRLAYKNEIHLTVAVVTYKTQDGVIHYGVCSNYLQSVDLSEPIYLFVRNASSFHLPSNMERPMILVGPGTGIAPFRSFWHHRLALLNDGQKLGKCWLFFGCRQNTLDLYTQEKQEMVDKKVLNRTFLALSREPNVTKTYVQDLMLKEECEIYKMLVLENGHFYVCGDVTMANNVYQTIKSIIVRFGNKNLTQAEEYMLTLRDENRYHEDIFGITLRTAEIHTKSRETARIRMASEP